MDKQFYNILLEPGTDEAAFLANEAAGMICHDNLDLFDMVLVMKLTEEEAETLKESPKVIECEAELEAEPDSYPTSTPRYESSTQEYRARYNPSNSENGADFTSMNTFFTSEFEGQTGFSPPIGYFGDTKFEDTVKSNFMGDYVDIVAVEAGSTADAPAQNHQNHIDFQEFNSTNSRFVPMDWSDINSSLTTTLNNQITNPNGAGIGWFSYHAAGVLSAAGGKYCGWGKNSSLRLIYLGGEATASVYYAVLTWHINKPINPITGTRNATVVTGAWGFPNRDHKFLYDIEDCSYISARDPVTNAVTTYNRGGYLEGAEFNITMNAPDSTEYSVTGDDRLYNGVIGEGYYIGNRSIMGAPGDRITITNNASANHPLYIKTSNSTGTGSQYPGVTGQGTSEVSFILPDQTINLYYVCSLHVGMGGTISSVKDTTSWGQDLRPFMRLGIIPRVIEDPADNTLKWMISIPLNSRWASWDTIMGQYAAYEGIYHFKSAGNNAGIAVDPDDPRWNTSVREDGNSPYVINSAPSGINNFSSQTNNGPTDNYPFRSYVNGGDNQFTVAACQQDDTNRLLDDYSNRGPNCDFAAYGAQTWTSYPIGAYADGRWGYFSGTSCAAPVAAGCAAVFLDWYVTQRGKFPSIAELKELMQKHAKENLIEDIPSNIDFEDQVGTSDPNNGQARLSPKNFSSSKLYSSFEVNRVKDQDYQNGGAELSVLAGTTPLRVHIPWGIRMGSGKYIAGGSEQTQHKRRPTSGSVWPRRKVSFSS